MIRPDAASALIVVDVQNCFVTGGSLAVEHGEDVVPVINQPTARLPPASLAAAWQAMTQAGVRRIAARTRKHP